MCEFINIFTATLKKVSKGFETSQIVFEMGEVLRNAQTSPVASITRRSVCNAPLAYHTPRDGKKFNHDLMTSIVEEESEESAEMLAKSLSGLAYRCRACGIAHMHGSMLCNVHQYMCTQAKTKGKLAKVREGLSYRLDFREDGYNNIQTDGPWVKREKGGGMAGDFWAI